MQHPGTLKLHTRSPRRQRHSATYVRNSSKTHSKYLNYDISSNRVHSRGSHSSVQSPHLTQSPCSYLHWLSEIFSYIRQQNVPPTLSGLPLTRHKKPSHLNTRSQVISTLSLCTFSSLSSLHPFVHWREKGTWCSVASHHFKFWNSRYHPFILLQGYLHKYSQKYLPFTSYIQSTCHRASVLTL